MVKFMYLYLGEDRGGRERLPYIYFPSVYLYLIQELTFWKCPNKQKELPVLMFRFSFAFNKLEFLKKGVNGFSTLWEITSALCFS